MTNLKFNKEEVVTIIDTKTFNETVVLKFNRKYFKCLHIFMKITWLKLRAEYSDSDIMKMSDNELELYFNNIADIIQNSPEFIADDSLEQIDALQTFKHWYAPMILSSMIKNCISSNMQDKFLSNLNTGIICCGRLYYKNAPFLVYDFKNDSNKSKAENFRSHLDYDIEFVEKKKSKKYILNNTNENVDVGFLTKEFCYDPVDDPNNTYSYKYYFYEMIPPRYFKIIASYGLRLDKEYKKRKYNYNHTFITQYSHTENRIHQKRIYCKPFTPSVEAIEEDINFNDAQEIDIMLFNDKHVNAIKEIKKNDTVIVSGKLKYNEQFNSIKIIPFNDSSITRGYTGGKVINHEIITSQQLLEVGSITSTIRCKVKDIDDKGSFKILRATRSCHNPLVQEKLPSYQNEEYEGIPVETPPRVPEQSVEHYTSRTPNNFRPPTMSNTGGIQ